MPQGVPVPPPVELWLWDPAVVPELMTGGADLVVSVGYKAWARGGMITVQSVYRELVYQTRSERAWLALLAHYVNLWKDKRPLVVYGEKA